MFVLLGFSCNDGDLEIAPVDFDTAILDFCEAEVDLNTTLFFKINAENALIVELQDGLLRNEESVDSLVSAIPSQSAVTYRVFDADVTRNYFCDPIPPTSPGVIQDILAEAGDLIVKTIRNEADTTLYEHSLSIENLTLVNEAGERLTNLNQVELGTVTTKLE